MDHKLRISVKGLFFNDQGEVLLIKGKTGNFWAAPGGGLEEGENLNKAVVRELLEETGYIGEVKNVIFIQDYLREGGEKQLEIFFRGRIMGQDETIKPDHEAKFFDKKLIQSITFRPKALDPFASLPGVEYKSAG